MIPRFGITASGRTATLRAALHQWASTQAHIVWLERAPGQDLLVLCASAQDALRIRKALGRGEHVDAAVAAAELQENTLACDQSDASELSSRALRALVVHLLENHGPCLVTDSETGENLTAQVTANVDALFR